MRIKLFSIKKTLFQPVNGVRTVQPGPTVTKIYKVKQTPVRIGSSHAGHSNSGYIHEHTPLPSLPSIPDEPIHKPDVNPNNQFGSIQYNVSSIGTPTHELQMETSQVIVDSSIKTEWKKPEGAVEIIPTVEDSPMPPTSTITGESHFGSAQVVVESLTKSEWKEHEHFDKTTVIDKNAQIIVSSSDNQIVTTEITESAATVVSSTKNDIVGMPILPIIDDHRIETVLKPVEDGQIGSSQIIFDSSIQTELKKSEGVEIIPSFESTPFQPKINEHNQIVTTEIIETVTVVSPAKNEIVGMPILPIIDDHRTGTVLKPVEDGQYGSSQIVVDSSMNTELKKTEVFEIIPLVQSTPIQSKMNDSEYNQIISTQTITSSTFTKTETTGQHSTQMTSSTSGPMVYQSTSANPNIDNQINSIVTSIIANQNAFGKRTIEPIPSTSTVHMTEVHEIGPERNLSSVDDEISEAFKDFVDGLMSTTPEARKNEPIFSNEQNQMDVTVTSTEAPAPMPIDVTVSTTIEAAKDIITHEMAPSTTIQSDSNSMEVIESIPSVVEVVTTQPTATGYEETKVIATKFTSDGPTFLEVSKLGFHTDNMMTSSTTESLSSQVISKSTFSYEDDQLISSSNVCNDSSVEETETSAFKTSSSEQTFTSFTEFSSSSTQIVSSPDQETFKFISSPVNEDGPTIVEISSISVEPNSPPTATTYVVSEPSYDYERSSPAADFGGSSYSYDDYSDAVSYDDYSNDD